MKKLEKYFLLLFFCLQAPASFVTYVPAITLICCFRKNRCRFTENKVRGFPGRNNVHTRVEREEVYIFEQTCQQKGSNDKHKRKILEHNLGRCSSMEPSESSFLGPGSAWSCWSIFLPEPPEPPISKGGEFSRRLQIYRVSPSTIEA